LVAALVATSVSLEGQSAAPRAIAIINATIVPMTSNADLLLDHTVVVANGRITAVEPSTTAKRACAR
jgi:imidazolonepropionase-like amidohydrolase